MSQGVQTAGPGTFEAEVRVLVGDGRNELDSYVGALYPEVVGWRSKDGSIQYGAAVTSDSTQTDWEVLVRPVRDAVVQISVRSLK